MKRLYIIHLAALVTFAYVVSLFGASLTQTEAITKATGSKWGTVAFVRTTKLANSYNLLYEVGADGKVWGGAYGSYDAAFAAAKQPYTPTNTLGVALFVDILQVEVDPACAGTSLLFGTIAKSPIDCQRTKARQSADAFLKDLCWQNVAYCTAAMNKYKVSFLQSGRADVGVSQ